MLLFPLLILTEHVLFTSLLLLIQWLSSKLKRTSFMSCCIAQAQKPAKPHSAVKHSLAQRQHKTALSRNKWGHSSFPLMQRERIYDRLEMTQLTSLLLWNEPIAVAAVKLHKDPLRCLPSITYRLLLNDPQREAQPNQRHSKTCSYLFSDKLLDFTSLIFIDT